MKLRLFGTDGIRGPTYAPPLDEATVRRLGAALAAELGSDRDRPHLLLAGDTRASTETLARWLGGSFQAAGGRVTWGGVLPTPAVSHLLRTGSWAAGVVISASHNPSRDNGIKVLAPSGEKIADAVEHRLELRLDETPVLQGPDLPPSDHELCERYLGLVVASHDRPRPLAGMTVAVDAAHGAASGLAEALFERLGARVVAVASQPDGSNINAGCGATCPSHVANAVRHHRAHAGVALDGDADRAILVDADGHTLDGDDILLAWGRALLAEERLPGRRLVATVMSNFGLERALARDGIAVQRCPVGDRSVWLAMREHRAALGGEQSGHVICAHHSVTGDGLVTATHLLALAVAGGRDLATLSDLERMPQVLVNVPVVRKTPFDQLPEVRAELAGGQSLLSGRGRILLRYSGTEPLARVMVEGEDALEIEILAARLADSLRRALA
jgi:phosphoglucosamine mutase